VNTWNDIREVVKQLAYTVTEPLENDPELPTGTSCTTRPRGSWTFGQAKFATMPHWLVGNPDRSC